MKRVMCSDKFIRTLILQSPTPALPYAAYHLLGGASYILGRSAQCDFVAIDSSVSRRHAELTAVGGEIKVCDLNSRNGTFIDGIRVCHGPVMLGQLIRFGALVFLAAACPQDDERPGSEEETDTFRKFSITNDSRQEDFSTAQRRVLDLLLQGLGEKQIAASLGLSRHTVHNHVGAIYRVLHVHSRSELLARLLRNDERNRLGETMEPRASSDQTSAWLSL